MGVLRWFTTACLIYFLFGRAILPHDWTMPGSGVPAFQVLAGELPAELPTESLMKMKNMAELFEDVLLDKVEDLSEDLDSVSSIVVLALCPSVNIQLCFACNPSPYEAVGDDARW